MENNNFVNMFLLVGILMAAALASGCASGPDRVEDDFGNSVRAMRAAQTIDMLAIIAPDTTPIESTDGQRMENVLRNHRERVSVPSVQADVFDTIGFDVDK